MLTKATARLIALAFMILIWGLSNVASAQSRDSNSQPIPRLEEHESEKITKEFFGRLNEHRSVAHRKQSVINEYARGTNLNNELQNEYEELQSQISAIQEKYSAGTMPEAAKIQLAWQIIRFTFLFGNLILYILPLPN